MKVLLHNVRVTDSDGEQVVFFGGDPLPAWAEGQVGKALVRDVADDVEDVVEEPVRVVDAFGVADSDESEPVEVFGDVDGS